jgi:hypothetical protein
MAELVPAVRVLDLVSEDVDARDERGHPHIRKMARG